MLEQFCGADSPAKRAASHEFGFSRPHGRARNVAEMLVFLVLHRHTAGAVLARKAAHIARDHHTVAGTDAFLITRGSFK